MSVTEATRLQPGQLCEWDDTTVVFYAHTLDPDIVVVLLSGIQRQVLRKELVADPDWRSPKPVGPRSQGPKTLAEARSEFYDRVAWARRTFQKHKWELADLKPAFWLCFEELELSADLADVEDLILSFRKARKVLGAPGDFGYGTPCGEALKELYNEWSRLVQHFPTTELRSKS